eukprot:13791851-Heterocapsa_arctica.AAC.1
MHAGEQNLAAESCRTLFAGLIPRIGGAVTVSHQPTRRLGRVRSTSFRCGTSTTWPQGCVGKIRSGPP